MILDSIHKVEEPASSRKLFQEVDSCLSSQNVDLAKHFLDGSSVQHLEEVLQLRSGYEPLNRCLDHRTKVSKLFKNINKAYAN